MGEHLFVADIREKVAELTAEGLSLNEVAHRLGVARSTVGYHVDVLRRSRDPARKTSRFDATGCWSDRHQTPCRAPPVGRNDAC